MFLYCWIHELENQRNVAIRFAFDVTKMTFNHVFIDADRLQSELQEGLRKMNDAGEKLDKLHGKSVLYSLIYKYIYIYTYISII